MSPPTCRKTAAIQTVRVGVREGEEVFFDVEAADYDSPSKWRRDTEVIRRRGTPKSLARMASHNEGHAVAAAQRRLAGKRRQLTLRTQLLNKRNSAVGLTFRLPTKPLDRQEPFGKQGRRQLRRRDLRVDRPNSAEVAKIARMDDWEWPATIHSDQLFRPPASGCRPCTCS